MRDKSILSIESCSITHNSASNGAVVYTQNTQLTMNVLKCDIRHNIALNDGGVFEFQRYAFRHGVIGMSILNLKHSKLVGNKAGRNGGVITSDFSSNLYLKDVENTFKNNSAHNGGIAKVMNGFIETINSTMSSNNATGDGILNILLTSQGHACIH